MLQIANLFARHVEDGYGGYTWNLTPVGVISIVLLIVLLLISLSLFNRKKKEEKVNVKKMVFSAMAITLAMVTSYLKLFAMPMGGSLTLLSMFFITLVGYWYGLRAGLTASIAYGLLQMVVDPYIITLPQMLCDYIFAFGALGLSGIFYHKKHGLVLGYITGVFGRFIFSSLSGVLFFAAAAPETMNPLLYSMAYNGSYMGAEALLTIIIICLPPVSKALEQIRKTATSH